MTQQQKTHLILALCSGGFGETVLGIRLVRELVARGERVRFIAHESNRKLMFGLPNLLICSPAFFFLATYCEKMAHGQNLGSIILADYAITASCFEKLGLDPHFLERFGAPIYAIDTWHLARTGAKIDLFGDQVKTLPLWPEVARYLSPVPFLSAETTPTAYRSLPQVTQISRKARQHVRSNLGLKHGDKAILFCSAIWQHHDYKNPAGERTATLIPKLLPVLLEELGQQVHIVHVGPEGYGLEETIPGRYHWLPALEATEFDTLLNSVDVMLSANFSASTIPKAILLRIPTVVLHNSHSIESLEELHAVATRMRSSVRAVFEAHLPLFPFLMWPLGYSKFLQPLVHDNPYLDTLTLVELLDMESVVEALRRYLFDGARRAECATRQEAYIAGVKALPRAVDLMTS